MTIEDIEKQFDEKFVVKESSSEEYIKDNDACKIKSFYHTKMNEMLKEISEEIKGKILTDEFINDHTEDIAEIYKSYNRGLKDALEIINSRD